MIVIMYLLSMLQSVGALLPMLQSAASMRLPACFECGNLVLRHACFLARLLQYLCVRERERERERKRKNEKERVRV